MAMPCRYPLLLAVLLAAGAAGCADDQKASDRLSGACQVQRCVCASSGWSSASAGGSVPVRWGSDGSPFCPEGLMLQRIEPRPERQ